METPHAPRSVITTSTQPGLARLREDFAGRLVTPGDAGYDEARRVWNATADRRPAVVAACATPGDVVAALRFARHQNGPVAVRGGGHSYPGFSTCDGGVVIDLGRMREVTVDPDRRIATVQAGALLKGLDAATQRHGLVCPNGAVGHTGVAGLTLGGGLGRLMRRFGLTIDNLIDVELVTADGRRIRASEEEHPDLFWGLRGAGANLGVATSFRFRLHPAGPDIVAGAAVWPAERAHEVAETFRQWSIGAPDDLTAAFSVFRAGDEFGSDLAGRPIVAIAAAHLGDDRAVARDLAPIRALRPALDTFARVSYLDMQTASDDYYAWGRRNYWKGVLLTEFPRATVDILVDRLDAAPSQHCGFGMITMGGAIRSVADEATAFSGRGANWWLTTEALWDDPAEDDAHFAWGRQSLAQLERVAEAANYVNDLGEPGEHNLRDVYGDARYERLVALKHAWDPDNVFRLNQNITRNGGMMKAAPGTVAVPDTMRASFSGSLIQAGDDGYEDARRVHNGLIDKRPALIARCLTTADVVDAVNLARERELEIAVRGGGHNVAGKAVTDGGLMIDLAAMKGIHVDPRTGTVRAQPGLTWREFNRAAAIHGLATTGGVVSTTGIAGLTLGGGFGWLMGRYGLAADNLLSAEVVTAEGRVLVAGADENADLFWALRGGGGNFGVVTSFQYRAHPVATVLGGLLVHPLSAAPAVLDFYRQFTAAAPDELGVGCGLVHAPDGSGAKIVALPLCHAAEDLQQAEADLKALREFGPPAMDAIQPMPYPAVNMMLDDGFPRSALNYWKSAFLTELSDAVVRIMVDAFEQAPSTMSGIILEHLHGEATRVDPTATAFPHRQPGYSLLLLTQWADPADTRANVAWTRETFEALGPHMTDRRYMNYMSADDGGFVRQAYGPNYDRLVEVKRRYDPGNLFRLNQNIDPGT